MKIRVLLNIGTNDRDKFPLLTKGEHEVSREDGMKLIQRGWAVSLEPPAPKVQAVPPLSSIKAEAEKEVEKATAKATADVKTYREKATRATESKSPANKEQ